MCLVNPRSFCVVGGGIVGLATAYRLGLSFPDADITVLEKESAVGQHQSGHNSGVLHAGLYYKPGSVKARLAVRGIRQMVAFCRENNIRHEICGKLVVAVTEDERPRLAELYDRGIKNGLVGLTMLGPEQMREIEPHVNGIAAVRVPEEGITDYPQVCRALAGKIRGRVVTNARVDALRPDAGGWRAITPAGDFRADFLINCAGLHCDRVAQIGVAAVPVS
jgi:L-2-hydroxyglutarate oxidase